MQQEKLQKATLKSEAAELKKMQQWEKGKFALKSIVADIDAKVVELGSVGGLLFENFTALSLSEICFSFSILWLLFTWNRFKNEFVSQGIFCQDLLKRGFCST